MGEVTEARYSSSASASAMEPSVGEVMLFSHSSMKLEAARLTLLGESLLRARHGEDGPVEERFSSRIVPRSRGASPRTELWFLSKQQLAY